MDKSNVDPVGEPALEDRLRGLILNNANSSSQPLPPHMLGASTPEKAAYTANKTQKTPDTLPSQPARKRMNQAQRRQNNSNLSIPIEPRQGPSQAGREYHQAVPQSRQSPQFNPSLGYNQQPYQRSPGHFSINPQVQHSPRYQHPQNSPRFQNSNPGSPYSPRGSYAQVPSSPQYHYSQGSNQHPQSRTGGNQYPSQFPSSMPLSPYARPPTQNRQLYQPNAQGGQNRGRPFNYNAEEVATQGAFLEGLVSECVPTIGIDDAEYKDKEEFRAVMEAACREAISQYERVDRENPAFVTSSVELKCFGSMASGFATRASDMDLALLTPYSEPPADSPESPIPRILERKLLDLGYGARLLTRTRVPIIKLCQKPTEKLIADLLAAREGWESGFTNDASNEVDMPKDSSTPAQPTSNHKQTSRESVPVKNEEPPSSPETCISNTISHQNESKEHQLSKLKQKDNQSLADYYNTAKRLMRKLGGRDVSYDGPPLTENENMMLNHLCKAFILGLNSEALISKLRTYQSIAPLFETSVAALQRSINGIWTQAEGEKMAMAWESRPVTENNNLREQECLRMIEAWRSLQNSCTGHPISYNKLLYAASEKLKGISSLQLVFLHQLPHEAPHTYFKRATKLLGDLQVTGSPPSSHEYINSIVIAHYISGITDSRIQDGVRQFSHGKTDLSYVSTQHKILQLAMDYEHALDKSLYDSDARPKVEQYISILWNPDRELLRSDSTKLLVSEVCRLPDPTAMSQNKPRDRYKDHLEFPKDDIGIQCDINFSAELALHNTLLLRCYSHSDPRVKTMVLFIKHWAKVRGINTPYRGTLSSYGYVLMVLHYLVNIAQPFVCPNLQMIQKEPPLTLSQAEIERQTSCAGRDVRFWRNEAAIIDLARRDLLNHNKDSTGLLLRGFFEYFAKAGQMTSVHHNRGFDWGREVLSIRSQHGIISKQEKGWIGAKTVVETTVIAAPPTPSTPAYSKDTINGEAVVPTEVETDARSTKPKTMEETKEIRHRYLFAIEDPFELDHNVARTVTHDGIVQIRDEFRRAWKIISSLGNGTPEDLLAPFSSASEGGTAGILSLLESIHGECVTPTVES